MESEEQRRLDEREYQKRYRETHRDQFRAYNRAYYAKHRRAVNRRHAQWKRLNAAKIKARQKDYYRANKDRINRRVSENHRKNVAGTRATRRRWLRRQIECVTTAYAKILLSARGVSARDCTQELIEVTKAMIQLKREIRKWQSTT